MNLEVDFSVKKSEILPPLAVNLVKSCAFVGDSERRSYELDLLVVSRRSASVLRYQYYRSQNARKSAV